MFELKFGTDNAAFHNIDEQESDFKMEAEVARILASVTGDIVWEGRRSGKVMDINGNVIGEWRLT